MPKKDWKKRRGARVWDNDKKGMSLYIQGPFANGVFVNVQRRGEGRVISRQFDSRKNMKPDSAKSMKRALRFAKAYMRSH